MNLAQDDSVDQARFAAFVQALGELGWDVGRNVQIDTRWGAGDGDRLRRYAEELSALAPDVMLATAATVGLLQQVTRTIPIVFVQVPDPVGSGYVTSLAHPGGNATGFMQYDFSLAAKWLELLKQIAPHITRIAVVRDPSQSPQIGQFGAIQSVAPAIGVELTAFDARDAGEIERAVTAFAREPNGGLIVLASGSAIGRRNIIIALAAKYRLPVVYPFRFFVTDGGLISYGPESIDPYRRAASYVDRILKGEKPADLPVQAPTKYELVINLKTAKALNLTIPADVLARADEVIE